MTEQHTQDTSHSRIAMKALSDSELDAVSGGDEPIFGYDDPRDEFYRFQEFLHTGK